GVATPVDNFAAGDRGFPETRPAPCKGKTAGEDRQMPQHDALGCREEFVAPIERRPKGLMPPQRGAKPFGEEAEPVVEPRSELLHTERRGARCRQLNGKRDAVKPPADRRHSRCGLPVQDEMRVRRLDPRDEQRYRALLQYIL